VLYDPKHPAVSSKKNKKTKKLEKSVMEELAEGVLALG